jgi:hypothetical protein
MRKIHLNADTLRVETFQTGGESMVRGTVQGFWSQVGTCDAVVATCQAGGTCVWTCGSKCGTTTVQFDPGV